MELKNSLILKYQICNAALDSLWDAIELLQNIDEDSKSKKYLAYQDSVIKRFEYSFYFSWKYVKEYIEKKYGVSVKSPKETFREAFKQNLLDDQDAECALDMVDDRNETSHRYDMAKAKEISKIIPKYYEVLVALIEKTKP